MSKYTKSEETIVCDEDRIIFENKIDSNYCVSTGITFKKSGLYNVLVESQRTVISKVADSQKEFLSFLNERIDTLPSAEAPTVSKKRQLSEETPTNTLTDIISRADAIDALAKEMPSLTTPDGSGEFDHDIQITDEAFVDCMQIINSLPSAEPCDKDAISREGLLRSWEELSPRGRTEFDQVIMTIPAIPSAEPKTGHWIDEETNYLCSKCHRGCWVNSDYCPWCGAYMRGEK